MKLKDIVFLSKKVLQIDRLLWKSKTNEVNEDRKENTHYRLVIINDANLKEAFSTVISRKKIYVFLSIISVVNFGICFLFFSYTPLKAILPENLNYKEKRKLITLKYKVDSLENLYHMNEKLIQQYKSYFVTSPQYQQDLNNSNGLTK